MTLQELIQAIAPYLKTKEGQLWLLLLSAVAVLVLMTLVWQTVSSLQLAFSGSPANVTQDQFALVTNKPTINSVAANPLFGQGEVAGQVNTHYQLLGVLFTDNPDHRKAIIGSPNQQPEIVKVNQNLKEGGKLYQVNADHILLLRNGKIEKVYMTWEGGAAVSPKINQPILPGGNINDLSAAAAAAGDSEDVNNQDQAEAWRERVQALQQKYQAEQNAAGGVVPNVQPGQPGQPGQNNPAIPGNPNVPSNINLPGGRKFFPRMMRGGI